jgi:hypothetical protein
MRQILTKKIDKKNLSQILRRDSLKQIYFPIFVIWYTPVLLVFQEILPFLTLRLSVTFLVPSFGTSVTLTRDPSGRVVGTTRDIVREGLVPVVGSTSIENPFLLGTDDDTGTIV